MLCALVGQTFLQSLDLDLEVETYLLLLVQLGCEFSEALLLSALEAVQVAAELLDLGVQVATIGTLPRRICTARWL